MSTTTIRAASSSERSSLRPDVRRPVLSRVLEAAGIDTVVLLGLYSKPGEAGGGTHDLNVIGAMQVVAACQKAERVTRVVVRSSTAVYGAEPSSPAVSTEDTPPAARETLQDF